jgi:membrane associated rhomboid family serine protease
MRRTPPPVRRTRNYGSFTLNPVLVLIAINFVIFIAILIRGGMVTNLGLAPAYFTERPWTIVTNMFVHISFWHILFNMITLYFFGTFLNRLIGQNKFLLLYFGAGIVGNFLYVLLGDPYSIVIGASGAIYGIAGALVVMMPRLTVRLYFIFPVPLWVVVLVFFVVFSFLPGVAWQAHLGGLAVGLAAGYFFRRRGGYYYIR